MTQPSPTPGGRSQALKLLTNVHPESYAQTRNHLTGAVTRLSPYLRHGCISLAEVRDHALTRATPEEAEKLLMELAWRDYYQHLYQLLGNDIWTDLEPTRALPPLTETLPQDLATAQTNLACMDAFSTDLTQTGYLHNHARMWLAAYLIHHRRVAWQAGARWFLEHLLDGDPASNNLSWQWVASTFSNKPYIFNRENLARFSDNTYCPTCPSQNSCPFDASYETLTERLFPAPPPDTLPPPPNRRKLQLRQVDQPTFPPARHHPNAVIWIHDYALSPTLYPPNLPALFVHDEPDYTRQNFSPKRIQFITECVAELSTELNCTTATGDPAPLLEAFAQSHNTRAILAVASPSPRHAQIAAALANKGYGVIPIAPPQFATIKGPLDLTRFFRFWNKAQSSVSRPTPSPT